MNWPTTISIIGSAASVFGAAFAWWQYQKSKKSALLAKTHADRLLNNTQIETLSVAITEIESVNLVLANYGPSIPTTRYSGLDYAADARVVQDHFARANAHVQAYDYPRDAKDQFAETPTKISALANSRRQDEAQRTGIALYNHCQSLKILLSKLKIALYRDDT